jgi:predicted DNA-binding transcriptional regulator YafY
MRADRLLSELLLLQAHGRLTGKQLAKRLEVSERTVHRDMEALSAARVPVFALRGAQGGWQLDENWRTQVPALEEAELRALLMAQPRIIGDSRLAAAAERALGKLMAALPRSLREQAANIRQRLFVDTTGWRGTTENVSMLPIAQEAVARDRKLEMVYKPMGCESGRRIIDPLGLVAKGTAWYLVANTPRGFRTYRVSRIESAKLLNKATDRPADFDLAEYWRSSTKQFQDGWPRLTATLRLEPRVSQWMRTWVSALVVTDGKDDPEGWVTIRVEFESEDEARFMVMGLGSRVDVIEPASLRDWVGAEVEKTASRRQRSFHGLQRKT